MGCRPWGGNVHICALRLATGRACQPLESDSQVRITCSILRSVFADPRYRFLEAQLLLHNSKDMFHFGSNGRFLALSALDLCSGSVGVLLALRWTTIDFVMNALTRFVCSYRFRALFGSEIAAVSVDNLLLSDQKFCYHAYIVFVGRCHFQCVHNASFVVNSHMDLVPEVPCVAPF